MRLLYFAGGEAKDGIEKGDAVMSDFVGLGARKSLNLDYSGYIPTQTTVALLPHNPYKVSNMHS